MNNFFKLTLEERVKTDHVIASAKAHVRMEKQGYDMSLSGDLYLHFLLAVYNEISKEIELPTISIDQVKDSKSYRIQLRNLINEKFKTLERIEWVAPNLD